VINVPKKSMMGQSIWLIQKERKSLLHTWININHLSIILQTAWNNI
jgi:hypothetical protein